jgi:hypothetical protein
VSSFTEWDRDACRRRVGEDEAARRRNAIMAEQWGYQLAQEQRQGRRAHQGLARMAEWSETEAALRVAPTTPSR